MCSTPVFAWFVGFGGGELVVEGSGFPLMAGDGIDCEIGRDEPKYM